MLENSVLTPASPDHWLKGRCRFLGVNADGLAVVISLVHKNTGPTAVDLHQIEQAIKDLSVVVSSPLTASLGEEPDNLSAKARADYEFWKPHFLRCLTEQRDLLLDEESRAILLRQITAASGRPEITVRRKLLKVLRGGRSLRALAPNFRDRGGAGKKQTTGAKRGRKAKPGSIVSEVALPTVRAAMAAAIEQLIGKEGYSIPQAYGRFVNEHFKDSITEPNGSRHDMLRTDALRPTRNQFGRLAKEMTSTEPPRRPGQRGGSAKASNPGPGYHYEIDATGTRLELVSEFDIRQRIGPATAYGLLDVRTTVCVGGVLGAFHAGYQAAQVALFNTFNNKKELCARWDIDISEENWPCHHLPRQITSDRGELVSDASEILPAELNVVLKTAPPYCPQMKGTIEGWFKNLKASDLRKLVGFGRKTERGERDPKDQAALTRYDGMRAFLLLAMQYNQQPAPVSTLPPRMLEDGYHSISRITLWQWLMRHSVSGARIEDPRMIYTSLLRKSEASIRHNGLFVKNVPYMSPELRSSGLLQRAAERGAISVQATVDDFAARIVWYRTYPDGQWCPAYLADPILAQYDMTFDELAEYYRKRDAVHLRSGIASARVDVATSESLAALSKNAIARRGGAKRAPERSQNVRACRAADARDERREHGATIVASYMKDAPPRRSPAPTPADTARSLSSAEQSQLDLVSNLFLESTE